MRPLAPELLRRLLVFRAAVATALFFLTLAADLAAWPLRRMSGLLYGVVVGTYLVVLLLGLLLRTHFKPMFLAAMHLVVVVVSAALVVHATGGAESAFSFFLVLTIFDAAMIGGRRLALGTASACCLIYAGQIAWQMSEPAGLTVPPSTQAVTNLAVSHTVAFYLTAWLAGHLAELWRRARDEASSAQGDLRRSELLYAHVMQCLPVGVLTIDAQHRVVSANAAFERILAVPALNRALVPEVVEEFLQRQTSVSMAEIEVAGAPRYVSFARSSLGLGADLQEQRAARDVVVVDDVTPLRALQDTLRAREKMASIGQLSAALAHELRNPLAAISGCVELFVADSEVSLAQRDTLGAIVLREIGRLNRLITDFLAYARPVTPQKTAVNVALLAREVCDMVRQDGRWQGHRLEVEAPAAVVAHADAGQVRQVLWNLIQNALEASPPHGLVGVRARTEAQGICLEVRDAGAGIPPAVRGRLFEPFQTTKEQGTGLGLAIVHTLVQAHGGQVEAIAAADGAQGTIMRVRLNR